MDRFCPICNKKLTVQLMIQYNDYFCNAAKDHHFSERVVGEERKMVKFRVSSGKQRLYCKFDYGNGYSEIWEGAENANRVRVEQVFEPNYSSVEGLVSKLRTYLVFS